MTEQWNLFQLITNQTTSAKDYLKMQPNVYIFDQKKPFNYMYVYWNYTLFSINIFPNWKINKGFIHPGIWELKGVKQEKSIKQRKIV